MKRSKRVNRIKLTPFVVPVIKKPRRLILGFNLVLEAGLEPARPDGHRILSSTPFVLVWCYMAV